MSRPEIERGCIARSPLRGADEAARALDADPTQGLSSQEALRRLARDGSNELRAAAVRPLWRRFLEQFQDPLVYLLLVAVAIALIAWLIEGRVGWPVDAVVIGAIVLLNATLGFGRRGTSRKRRCRARTHDAVNSTVFRDGREQRVSSAQSVRGDVLMLAAATNPGRPQPRHLPKIGASTTAVGALSHIENRLAA